MLLEEIYQYVLEKKMKIWKVYRQTDEQQEIRWAMNTCEEYCLWKNKTVVWDPRSVQGQIWHLVALKMISMYMYLPPSTFSVASVNVLWNISESDRKHWVLTL